MKVVIGLAARFERTPDGRVWTQTMFPHSFWKRYLEVFDTVRVVARVRDVESRPEGWLRVDGERVEVHALPYFVGPEQYLRKVFQVRKALKGVLKVGDAVILRYPSLAGDLVLTALPSKNYPFALEVVANPHGEYAPGANTHPARPIFRWWFTRKLRQICARAHATSYVTANALQAQYPPQPGRYTTNYSSIELSDSAFAPGPRRYAEGDGERTVTTVGSLSQMYKGVDVLIDAIAECVGKGRPLQLRVVGDGKHRSELEAYAEARGVASRVQFTGQLTAGAAVRQELDRADLFVLPSRTEGLPRVLIEAMARGLPCLGSRVGGIPELLGPSELLPPGDPTALASKLLELAADPGRMAALSQDNFEKAGEYHDDVLHERRVAFYQHVHDLTAESC